MKKIVVLIVCLVLAVSCVSVGAADIEYALGEVIYHQNFAHISDFSKTGIKVGNLSTKNATYECDGENLNVITTDSGRAYNILPEGANVSSYTVELTFSFTDTTYGNGYLAFMLTCRGDEPSNITPITFRADGTIDSFSDVPEELAAAISSGEQVTAIIPVEDDVLYHITMIVGDTEYHLERDSMITIGEGNMGLQYRHIGVAVYEIYIVNGVDYLEKTGHYLDSSFAEDDSPVVTPDNGENGEGAPVTSDSGLTAIAICVLATGAALVVTGKKIYDSKKYD